MKIKMKIKIMKIIINLKSIIKYKLGFKYIKIKEIFLLNLKKHNKFIYDIIVIILFHQSSKFT